MPRFFIDGSKIDDIVYIRGEDAKHIGKSLRMQAGEGITLCDCKGYDYHCTIVEISEGEVKVKVNKKILCKTEPSVFITLYQGLPKSDKMDTIIQKSVEIGVSRIVPVITDRSISRPDGKSIVKKEQRWQKISLEAAKQSGRGIIPEIEPAMTFDHMLNRIKDHQKTILFYEKEGAALNIILKQIFTNIGVIIGPEGGFEDKEVTLLQAMGGVTASLGPRILRTETAGLAALSAIMYATGNMK